MPKLSTITNALRIASHRVAVAVGVSAFGLGMGGCAGTTPNVDNPVLGAAPPRKPGAVVAQADQPKSSDVVSVSYETGNDPVDEWNEVAGRVDGIPVFARDVLEADRPRLDQMKKHAPREAYLAKRQEVLKARLPQYLEQQLLLAAVKEELKAEQMTAVEEQLDKLFLDEIERLKKIAKVSTVAALEDVLAKQNTSLASLRQAFFDRQMSGQYLGLKMSKMEAPTRADAQAEYQSRLDEYRLPADVKWQQLWISFGSNGGESGAFDVLNQAVADIKAGVPFDVVIGRYSDGAMKENGGVWDYTTRGNLTSREVEDALFSLPIGQVSKPYKVGNAYQIVRVADRREERVTPFEDLEDKLMKELAKKSQNEAAGKVIAELWKKSAVETRFDDDPDWQEMITRRYGSAISAGAN